MGIAVIGAIFIDIKGFPENKYVPLGRNKGNVEYVHGGVSRNVAENIANMHIGSTFISIADESGLGDEAITYLDSKNVDTRYIQKIKGGMGTYLAVFDENGDLAGSISQRPNLLPIMALLEEKGDEIISGCDSLILEADIDRCIMDKVFELCSKYNKKIFTIVSNMPLVAERKDLAKNFTCFVCNDVEIGQFFNCDFSSLDYKGLLEVLPPYIRETGLQNLVVTLGDKGSIWFDQNGDKGYVPARKIELKDSTGAGDAFCTGLSAGMTYGKTLKESCEIGTFLASAVITSTDNVIPSFDSVKEFSLSL